MLLLDILVHLLEELVRLLQRLVLLLKYLAIVVKIVDLRFKYSNLLVHLPLCNVLLMKHDLHLLHSGMRLDNASIDARVLFHTHWRLIIHLDHLDVLRDCGGLGHVGHAALV